MGHPNIDCGKVSGKKFVLRRIISFGDLSLSNLVYYSLFEQAIMYILWGGKKGNLENIFKLQKKGCQSYSESTPSIQLQGSFYQIGANDGPFSLHIRTPSLRKEQKYQTSTKKAQLFNTNQQPCRVPQTGPIRAKTKICRPKIVPMPAKFFTGHGTFIFLHFLAQFKSNLKHYLRNCFYKKQCMLCKTVLW
jgi:hypothetical protein